MLTTRWENDIALRVRYAKRSGSCTSCTSVGEKENHVKCWLISPAPDEDSKLVPSKRSQARQSLILVGWINSNWNGTSLECWLTRENRITRKEIYPSSIAPQVPAWRGTERLSAVQAATPHARPPIRSDLYFSSFYPSPSRCLTT
jgi:hypothetical protein